MRETLEALACSDKGWAAERAQIALQMVNDHDAGALSDSEFAELMQDLVRADRLDEEADDLEVKTMLVTAVYACAQII
jgi:uncharacterized protein YqjF (DUF2071 family)